MRRPHQLRPVSPSEARAACNAGLRREATITCMRDGGTRAGPHPDLRGYRIISTLYYRPVTPRDGGDVGHSCE